MSLLVQKIEEPVRTNFPENTDSGAQNFGPKQSEADDFLKSKAANPDTEIFGTDVGIVDAMRFKGAGKRRDQCRIRFAVSFIRLFRIAEFLSCLVQLLKSSTAD